MNRICQLLAAMMISTGLLMGANQAQAQTQNSSTEMSFQTVSLGSVTLRDSQTKSLSLGKVRFIRNLVISAEGFGSGSMVEVMVNGLVKGTLYAPGRDPSFVVTIGEVAGSIEFRHRSGEAMRLNDVLATVSTGQGSSQPAGQPTVEADGDLQALAQKTLNVLESLRGFISPADEAMYFTPIRQQAGLVLAYAGARGEHSNKAIVAAKALQYQIAFARNYLEDLMQNEATFDFAVELIHIQESIDDLLN
jgi:hypothetical protein